MVKIGLQIKAQLENVTDLRPDGDDFRWYLKLKCANCGDVTHEYVYLNLLEKHPVKGGRGEVNLAIKCKLCSRDNSIDIIKESYKKYTAEDSNKLKTIVVFDCRGVEPVDFDPRIGWACDGVESGSAFNEVSLVEKEWCDYDEKSKESVGVYELEHNFVKVK